MPDHGPLICTACKDLFRQHDEHDGIERWGQGEALRLENNPGIWGSATPAFVLLGFSKGGKQNAVMSQVRRGTEAFEAVPFAGMRHRLNWLLRALRLIAPTAESDPLFQPTEFRCQSASLIKCSMSARTRDGGYSYKMADILDANAETSLVEQVAQRCVKTHHGATPAGVMFLMLGLDKNYIALCRRVFEQVFGRLTNTSATTYRTETLSWAHVAHPSGNQTDPQYQRWVAGETRIPKVAWAITEIDYRLQRNI